MPKNVLAALLASAFLTLSPAYAQSSMKSWPVTTPRAAGLDPKVLARLDAEIARGDYGHVDSMLVIRHGRIAYERTYKRDYETIYASTRGPVAR